MDNRNGTRRQAPAKSAAGSLNNREALPPIASDNSEKQRGYYSELVAPDAVGDQGLIESTSAGPRVATAGRHGVQRIPLASSYRPRASVAKATTHLDQSLAPENGASNGANGVTHPPIGRVGPLAIPPRALEPKVMSQYTTIPGKTPRKIEIERKKRLFAAQDINQLLRAQGVDYSKTLSEQPPTYLPLEIFDDCEYEARTVEEWLSLGKEAGVMRGVPARYVTFDVDGRGVWHDALVLDFSRVRNEWVVLDEASGQNVSVHRIHLLFLAEDPFAFAERVARAHTLRSDAEAMLRYNLYIDCMPGREIPPMEQGMVDRIHAWTVNHPKWQGAGEPIEALQHLLGEVGLDYTRAMNKIIFDTNRRDPNAQDQFGFLSLPPEPALPEVPWLATVEVPQYDFEAARQQFTFQSFMTKGEVIKALQAARAECNELLMKSLFNPYTVKSLRLDEFNTMQNQAIAQTIEYVKKTWLDNLTHSVQQNLKNVGKGWFNMLETSREVHEISPLRKFMCMVKFIMQDSLRSLAMASLTSFRDLIVNATPMSCVVKSTCDVIVTERTAEQKEKDTPLFHVDLNVREGKFAYSTPPRAFNETPQALFLEAILKLQDIPQLEPRVMTNLSWASIPLLQTVDRNDEEIVRLREDIRRAMAGAVAPLEAYLKAFEQHESLLQLDPAEFIKQYEKAEPPHSVQEMKEEILMHTAKMNELEETIPRTISLGLFRVSCDLVKTMLVRKRKELARMVLEALGKRTREKGDRINREFEDMSSRVHERPGNIEALQKLRDYMATVPAMVRTHQASIEQLLSDYDVLEEFRFSLSVEDFNRRWWVLGWPRRLDEQMEGVNHILEKDKSRFQKDLHSDQDTFAEKMEELQRTVATFSKYADLNRVDEIAAEVQKTVKAIQKAQATVALYNSREALFNLPITEYEAVKEVVKAFEPYRQLWLTAADWTHWIESWYNDPFIKLDAVAMETNLSEAWKTMFKLVKVFKDIPQCLEIAMKIKQDMDEFKPHVPLIVALRNPGMKDRHWDTLSAELTFELRPNADTTLVKIFEMNLEEHLEPIQRAASLAGKEYAIEQALDKMLHEWEARNFEIVEYSNTETFILTAPEDIKQLLDDHIMMTQAMSFSAFKKPFEERISKWSAKLDQIQDIVDEWLKCQKQWLYLQPIFTFEDINRQMPTEGKRFKTMDTIWRKLLGGAHANPNVLHVCSNDRLLPSLKECFQLLESVQRGLNDYLETKRAAFPRFYFLSNDDLLEILSQTRDPTAVQKHLPKCFENIHRLTFGAENIITAMSSGEGETIPFVEEFLPKGNVESWLFKVEQAMKASVLNQIRLGVADYARTKRTDWVKKWPAQVVLTVSQIYWTQQVTTAIKTGGVAGLKKLLTALLKQIEDVTDMVRGQLPKLTRRTMAPLIVMDVHCREVTRRLIEDMVSKETDFEWMSQLRYYWVDDTVKVRMATAEFAYGCEYLGNTDRLVITPLTDRCYLTLTGALHMQMGGAPQGPAGTGKTETTKDLAKALAKQCVVFNCQDRLDHLAMGKFFKGLASSGAWACFDEFNRIEVEVLSVIATQILTIQQAIQATKKRFLFDDVEIPLDASCAVFVTMNPGYAGRAELPDNLKALLRPVAMMVPDYAMIAEISLFSFGFSNSQVLSQKMTTTFKLCSEQLSSASHYDFGMRAVKTVINAAGNLKRAQPTHDEELILLRALRDCNEPKFLDEDLPLFSGILSDLFPGKKEAPEEYGQLTAALRDTMRDFGLQPLDYVVVKCIQLYETTVVRHGLMLVGPTGGGKTTAYRVLAEAMTRLKGVEPYVPVRYDVLNPKAITKDQMYGAFSDLTHEWTEGVLANIVRSGAEDEKPDKKWVIFDGPVDALWIEDMNTVLDDNKKLCLASGKIIKLSEQQTIMFEVEDLKVASPATVSRCGMVYMEPNSMGTLPLFRSWLLKLPAGLKPQMDALQTLYDKYVDASLAFMRKSCNEGVPTVNGNLINSMCSIMSSIFFKFQPEDEGLPIPAESITQINEMLEHIFLFSLVYSIGATVNTEGRKLFDQFLRAELRKNGSPAAFPRENTIYDYALDYKGSRGWKDWMDTIPPFRINPKASFTEMIVPTSDTVRYTFLLDLLLHAGRHVLCTGQTGTGKTLVVQEKIMKAMDKKFEAHIITFSARTSANQTQDILDSKFSRRPRGWMGPPNGKKFVIMVDELNLPQLEEYGAQPPIELLRQWMDHNGWYDRKALQFRKIVDINFVACMGPPSGGRNPITARFMRHFNVINFTQLEDNSLGRIYSTILGHFLTSFNESVQTLTRPMVAATIAIYNQIQDAKRPTPNKSHYTFNMRDLSKVFQGLLSASKAHITDPKDFVRLWIHETTRVFHDRLINDEDRQWFNNEVQASLPKHFGLRHSDVVGDKRLIYADFVNSNAHDARPVYTEVTDMDLLTRVVEDHLEDYNATSKTPMRLVMFLDAIEHVTRIARVIRQPGGHMLLLGMGGSGRQSAARLATHIAMYDLKMISLTKSYGVTEWREDLKQLMRDTGMGQGKPFVFLLTDQQIIQETFLEDINNLLNSGDVPNIWQPDELEVILDDVRPQVQNLGLPLTKASIYSQFLRTVQANLHIVMCMSPIGDMFRNRLRMFPSLVNCCTLDWFSGWPAEALSSVARTFLTPTLRDRDPKVVDGVIQVCTLMHTSVEARSKQLYDELKRYNYVTPASYLELLNVYKKVLDEKQKEQLLLKKRLEDGLERLTGTRKDVEILQADLEAMQPLLAQSQKDVDASMAKITQDKEAADKTRMAVVKEEEEARKQAKECEEIAASAKQDLDAALPALDEATEELRNLKRNHLVEVRGFTNPPGGVVKVMAAVCIMFQIKPKRPEGGKAPAPGDEFQQYWEPAKTLLNNPTEFLASLLNFPKDSIPEAVIAKIRPFINDKSFTPAIVATVSFACRSICMWVRAMEQYHQVAKVVAPKREAHDKARASLDATMASLREAQQRLSDLEANIRMLEALYEESVGKREELTHKVEECQQRLSRAEKLINGLGSEKTRWAEGIEDIKGNLGNLVGDALLSSGVIAYLGAFPQGFRTALVKEWTDRALALAIPHTANFSLVKVLAEPVQIRQWNVAGLPKDMLSTENGVIVKYSRRWPLMIDPQGQANKWVKAMEKDKDIKVIKLSDREPLRILGYSVSFGQPVLIENVGEDLDPALEPILLRQTYIENGRETIKLGDQPIPYNQDFRMYITTKIANPHYKPETSTKVTLLNFTLSPEGLEDQLLGIVVQKERRDLEDAKNHLVNSNARMRAELKELEDRILMLLSTHEGNPLDDETLIDTLANSKKLSIDIKEKVAEAEKKEKEINVTRLGYTPVAVRARILFFCITDLVNVDPMYQYSLNWYISLFGAGLSNAEASDDLQTRLKNIKDFFTYSLYCNICRSLFEKHKLLFSFLLCVRILQNEDRINPDEFRFLLAGSTAQLERELGNPAPEWLTKNSWTEVQQLSRLPLFAGFVEHFIQSIKFYKQFFDSAAPHKEDLPGEWHKKLNSFQRLLVLRCIRPDKVTDAVQDFVAQNLSPAFIEPPAFDLASVYRDSSAITPLIFILSPGADPYTELRKFADEMRFSKKLASISLGKGQGTRAELLISEAMERGTWVLLENCHLAVSWLPTLERIVDQWDPDQINRDFRLWLTSMPSDKFPVMVLQDGMKMTNEPPKGMRNNILRSFNGYDDAFLNESRTPDQWRKLLFSLCFFHGIIQERRKFGPLGWNIPYEFTLGDLQICVRQLHMFLEQYEEPPYKVLKFLAGEINYGGRVTDDKDRRTIMNILEDYYNPKVLEPNHVFVQGTQYINPAVDNAKSYQQYIKSLPLNDSPNIFGLHENANMTYAQNETYALFNNVLSLQPRGVSSGAKSRETQIKETATFILSRLPLPTKIETVLAAHPISYMESMTTVLYQEVGRFNGVLSAVRATLEDLLKALDGLVVMSSSLESIADALYNNQVPKAWAKICYPSLMPLAEWVKDLLRRVQFIQDWIQKGIPPVFWISGFFFPQAFLTGTLQNYARKHAVSVDTISFECEVLNKPESQLTERPEDGCYIRGLFLEGARWDPASRSLVESNPKELYTRMPVMWLKPVVNHVQATEGVYRCPVYKTLSRAGELLTTGHSTNYVMSIDLPSNMPQNHWIKRGVAMFCSLNFFND